MVMMAALSASGRESGEERLRRAVLRARMEGYEIGLEAYESDEAPMYWEFGDLSDRGSV